MATMITYTDGTEQGQVILGDSGDGSLMLRTISEDGEIELFLSRAEALAVLADLAAKISQLE